MIKVLALMKVVEFFANDMHYNTRGREFYQLHLMADRIKDEVLKFTDELKEVYFMGFKDEDPPSDIQVYGLAAELYDEIKGNTPCVLSALAAALKGAIGAVDKEKAADGLPGGVQAILDNISGGALTSLMLVTRQMDAVKPDEG